MKTTTIIKQINAMGFHAFTRPDNPQTVIVSGEHGDCAMSYYDLPSGPWINPKLVAFASKNQCHWEWENPGSIALYEA